MTAQPEATNGDLLVQLRRIADALEAQASEACNEAQDGSKCFLLVGHRGYHVTGDGRTHWLDDE